MSSKLFYIILYLCAYRSSKYTQLSTQERIVLEWGFREGDNHCFRTRSHVILLKADGRTSKDVGLITDMSHISVNHWGKRFKSERISSLRNKPRQECKPIRDSEDKGSLLEAVKAYRQRVQVAKAEWEASRGKSISDSTMHRFLKVLTKDMKG